MKLTEADFLSIREAVAAIPGDVSNDAVGAYAPRLQDMYAPATHVAALDPTTPIVVGSRGAGKSFWSGVLGQAETRQAASLAYPGLKLDAVTVAFGFTGVGGPDGFGVDALNQFVPSDADREAMRSFWWATVLRAVNQATNGNAKFREILETSKDWELRENFLSRSEENFRATGVTLLVVYDALDTIAITWPRRRLLTETLLEVVWAMRAYRTIRLKLFLRPDQIDDDELKFIELPKLRTGAVRLNWTKTDLYGLLYSRLMMSHENVSFQRLVESLRIPSADRTEILARRWELSYSSTDQARVMTKLAGEFMAEGPYGYKKGRTYDWPLTHLADAFDEVTPRSFLGLMIAAAKFGSVPTKRALTADGIRHGLRAASKTRVDQLHLEFPWIKGVLAPMAGLLMPQNEHEVFKTWKRAGTVDELVKDAEENNYLPPFEMTGRNRELALFEALKRIGVMFRRKDDRLDMPDLFRVAAKLLKKGGTAPV
jgi:hypothetical protein